MSPTFYVVLVVIGAVIHVEGMPLSRSLSDSFTPFIIQFNNTVCEVQNDILLINGEVIGNLTEEQKDELNNFSNKAEQWSSQLYRRIQEFFARVFGMVKSFWGDAWNLHSQLSPQLNATVTESESRDQEKDDDPLTFSVLDLDPPSFCKVN